MTTVRTPPSLFEFISMEEQQVLVSLAKGREELAVIAHLEGLYKAAMSFKSAARDDFVIFQLLTFTHYHFLFSTACQMRCHLSEAFASARSAIDGALIGAHIIHDRASQVAYAKREKPFDNFARYLGNLIKDKKALPHRLVPTLFKQHKLISTFASHADVNSFVHRITKSWRDDAVIMNVEYFQFARDDTERKIHALTLFHTFVMTLDIFSEFLVVEQKVVPAQWQQEIHKLGHTIERRMKVLRASLPPDPDAVTAA
jgi:hypothetical protein